MAYPTADGKTFVRVSPYGAVGYDLATGRTRWRLVLPKGTTVCASTRGAPGYVGAFVYGEGRTCTKVLAFDVPTGRRLWSGGLGAGDRTPYSAGLAVAGGRVYVASAGRLAGYDARVGPHGTGAAAPVTARPPTDCVLDGVVATIETCPDARRRSSALTRARCVPRSAPRCRSRATPT